MKLIVMLNRNFIFLLLLAVPAITAFYGCGGGGSGTTETNTTPPSSQGTAPTISGLTYSPTKGLYTSNHTAETVSGSVNVSDPDGNITSIVISSQGQAPVVISTNIGTATSAKISLQLSINIVTTGKHNFEVYAVDSNGNQSNKISGIFNIGKIVRKTSTYSTNAQGVILNSFDPTDSLWTLASGQYVINSIDAVDSVYTCMPTRITVLAPNGTMQTWGNSLRRARACGGGAAVNFNTDTMWSYSEPSSGSIYVMDFGSQNVLTVEGELYSSQ